MIYRAATQLNRAIPKLLNSRSGHTYHTNRAAALRALDRWNRHQTAADRRGYIWPAGGSIRWRLTCADLVSCIPTYVETVAL